MSQWSTYFQNPEFLQFTRMYTLKAEMAPLVKKWLHLKDNLCILDVGCGSGEFTNYLAKTVKGCRFVGVDIDGPLLDAAKDSCDKNTDNTFEFLNANALKLPFKKGSFDIVVSHTFFTNVQKPNRAMHEMMRVAKDGGIVASVTAQSFDNIPLHPGIYPPDHKYYTEFMTLYTEVFNLYQKHKPLTGFLKGEEPMLVPQLFAKSGMLSVCMYSTSNDFSLSNAAYDDQFKLKYIDLKYKAELKKFNAFMQLKRFASDITPKKAESYKELLKQKRDTLSGCVGENKIWDWHGGSTIVMTGIVPPV